MSVIPRKGIFIVLSSPSGGGKTSIMHGVIDGLPGITYSVSYTTRQPRQGEVSGRDYVFVDEQTFKAMEQRSEFIESARVHGAWYGTPRKWLFEQLERGLDVVLDIDVQGAIQLQKTFRKGIFIFIFPPSLAELERRLRGRGSDSEEVIQNRLRAARYEMSLFQSYDYLVVNERLSHAISAVHSIIVAERHRIARMNADEVKTTFQLEQVEQDP